MTGRLVRGFCTAAAAAVAAGSLVAGTAAYARPGPAPGSGGARDGGGVPVVAGHNAASAPVERPVRTLLHDLQRRYAQAEAADTAYRAAKRRLERRRTASSATNRRLARARRALHDSRVAAGRLARMQYQGSSTALSPYVRLLLARDPQHALDQGHMLQRVSAARARVVHRLTDDERRARTLAASAARALRAEESRTARQRRQRDAARARLAAVERQLAAAHARQEDAPRHRPARSAPPTPDRTGTAGAPASPVPDGANDLSGRARALLTKALGEARPPSRAGTVALRYALRQLGKPYRWGASGPDAFDCSGLTAQAWAHAGRPIPRTSQAQWRELTRVPMDQIRPGDLVVYYPGATHVALYLGGGTVVQAPRSGERVKVSPVRSNPVLGAVRPDPGGTAAR